MYETDLPCTECSAHLVERLVPPTDHPLGSAKLEQISVAVCVDCGVRHYPEATLAALVGGRDVRNDLCGVEN